ncbi:MAG: phosphoribosyltransferase family protein [Patescibacteria group bacterium]
MWQKIIEFVQNLLVPEDSKIKGLMNLEPGVMRDLLPKSAVYSKDIFVLFDYQNKIVRFIVKAIKYKNNQNLRKRIACYFYEELVDMSSEISLFEGSPPLLVPMPMSPNEKRKRGFNQCEELVREIKKLGGDNIEVSYNTLKKVRETKRQTELSREERILNVKNSMSVDDFLKTKNRVIIVLDDVFTTGASLSEARRALLEAGAKRVIGIFIAH